MATMAHDPADADEAVLLDADLSILGAAPATYDRYVAAVREEYAHVDDAGWRAGRSGVLRGFLDRPQIYATASDAGPRRERGTCANLERELATLSRALSEPLGQWAQPQPEPQPPPAAWSRRGRGRDGAGGGADAGEHRQQPNRVGMAAAAGGGISGLGHRSTQLEALVAGPAAVLVARHRAEV